MPVISVEVPDELLPGLNELGQNAKKGRAEYLRDMLLQHFDYLERVRVTDERIAELTAGNSDRI